MELKKLSLDDGALCEVQDAHQDYGITVWRTMTNNYLRLRQRTEVHRWKNLIEDTINLSEHLNFDFYDPVWYLDTLSGEKA